MDSGVWHDDRSYQCAAVVPIIVAVVSLVA